MSDSTSAKVANVLKLKDIFREKFGMKKNPDSRDPLTYCGVTNSDIVAKIAVEVEKYFGEATKPAGQGCFFKNLFNPVYKQVGALKKDQTFYMIELEKDIYLYCAFWPWGSDPVKTSVRLGILSPDDKKSEALLKEYSGKF
ncbi:MAG: hypothetical protein GX221_02575 [Candidatus Riflebacteria bacterium]|nr:hypothetical protein [Candidatus Riflebacteria bacterium]